MAERPDTNAPVERTLIDRILRYTDQTARNQIRRHNDSSRSTFSYWNAPLSTPIRLILPRTDYGSLLHIELTRHLSEQYIQHRFDILGSGWQPVCHNVRCAGLEGRRYGPDTLVYTDRLAGRRRR